MKRTPIFAAIASLAAAAAYSVHCTLTRYMARAGLMAYADEPEIKDLPELAAELKKRTDEVKAIAEDFNGKAKAGEKLSQEAKDRADVAMTELNKLREIIKELEQKAARALQGDQGQGGGERKSIGQQFIEHEGVKKLLDSPGQRGRADMEVKATITLATADVAGAAGDLVRNTRLAGLIAPPERRLTVRDLITPGQMDGNALEYVKETGFTNNAAPVAEGAAKPQTDLKFDLVSTTAKVIAHYVKASRQIMSDAPMLASYIDGRLLYGLAFKEEQQLLNGDGTGQNLLGIIPQATAFVAPGGLAAANSMDQMRLAMLQTELAEYPATGHVMNPIDWTRIELLKDSTGQYIIGNPQGGIAPRLWNLPVVATQAMAQDKFLTGAFRLACQLFDRWRARVELATENEDDFIKNLVTILCEERLALAVYRPEALIYGDLGFIA
jgi:HK97 family phage major capsid protein